MQPGALRRHVDETLRDAYGEGLLSDSTFAERVDRLLGEVAVDPAQLIGDLTLRASRDPRPGLRRLAAALWPVRRSLGLLTLDWTGAGGGRLSVGRAHGSDILLDDTTVSRSHAELLWRSGTWIVRDLGSRNGTFLNGSAVQRAQLQPGDRLEFAVAAFRVD